MVRPLKAGIDYFPLDVDIDQDDKVALIEARHGIEGFGVMIKLLMKIYKEGYVYAWSEREELLFSKRIHMNQEKVQQIVSDCLNEGLFNKTLYKKFRVLTSHGIQKRYLEAVKRRKEVRICKHYFLLEDLESILGHSKTAIYLVDRDGKEVNVNQKPVEPPHSDNQKSQRKEKQNKETQTSPSTNYNPRDLEMATLLFDLMKQNNPHVKKPNIEKWAQDCRRMHEQDQRTYEQIEWLIRWSQADSFWKSNILSMDKLRKKFDQLIIKIKTAREQNSESSAPMPYHQMPDPNTFLFKE
ncbi:DUF4373 domain-containing protein [Virgibacillus sp. MSP4-1]|uniref:DUF4373 domain-containing protein n=1 Tax=Virgibacillus sp. MSP4-1 TaxID=2700081 RepID=UPI0003A9F80A|nr:DUF4373 domain-containing protein [Virgibacillus sp. MSP4-1]QHS22019.1 DUF4373 domain-containing protein [Virgibacillus sp. MSP4-1]